MNISQTTIDEIKDRIDILDVIGDFVSLKRTGQHYKGKSPFSDEKTPSFIVFPRNQNFKDFSSGKQGDAISFIMEYDGLSYVEAIKYLAKKYGVEVEEETGLFGIRIRRKARGDVGAVDSVVCSATDLAVDHDLDTEPSTTCSSLVCHMLQSVDELTERGDSGQTSTNNCKPIDHLPSRL